MEEAAGLSFSRGRNRLDLQRRATEGLKLETRRAEVVQVVDDPCMLARRHFNNGRNQEALTRSISLKDLSHQKLEENPFGGRPAIEQDQSFVAFEHEVTVANRAQEAESLGLPGVFGNPGLSRGGFLLQGDQPLRRLRYEGRGYLRRLRSARKVLPRSGQRMSRRVENGPPNRLRLP